jgi:hypothetical protein
MRLTLMNRLAGLSVGWLRMCVRVCVCHVYHMHLCVLVHAPCVCACSLPHAASHDVCVAPAGEYRNIAACNAGNADAECATCDTTTCADAGAVVCACSCVCVCVFVCACVCMLMRSLCLVQHANSAWHACASCRAVTAAAPLMQRV